MHQQGVIGEDDFLDFLVFSGADERVEDTGLVVHVAEVDIVSQALLVTQLAE